MIALQFDLRKSSQQRRIWNLFLLEESVRISMNGKIETKWCKTNRLREWEESMLFDACLDNKRKRERERVKNQWIYDLFWCAFTIMGPFTQHKNCHKISSVLYGPIYLCVNHSFTTLFRRFTLNLRTLVKLTGNGCVLLTLLHLIRL